MTKKQAEVFIAMNEDGDYAVGVDADSAREALDEGYGGYAVRIVKINVGMTPPTFDEAGASVDVPDDAPATTE